MTQTISRRTATALLGALALGAIIAAPTTPAAASEHCKGVYIKVTNTTNKAVKIIDLDYHDESANRWRSEAVKNRVLRPGESWSWRKRLEKVGAEDTRIRVEYREYIGKRFNKWSKVKRKTTRTRRCTRNMAWNINI